jgi:hypothetical protein
MEARHNMTDKTVTNVTTGETVILPYTAEEKIQYDLDKKEIEDAMAVVLAEKQAKATAKAALLAQLGITEEQARLLLS